MRRVADSCDIADATLGHTAKPSPWKGMKKRKCKQNLIAAYGEALLSDLHSFSWKRLKCEDDDASISIVGLRTANGPHPPLAIGCVLVLHNNSEMHLRLDPCWYTMVEEPSDAVVAEVKTAIDLIYNAIF